MPGIERTLQLRSQLDVLNEIEALVQDASNTLWSEADIYRAINTGLNAWGNKVLFPRMYTIPGGFSPGVFEYPLPDYIGQHFVPYIAVFTYTYPEGELEWLRLSGWSVEPGADGGRLLRIYMPYQAHGRMVDAKLIWYAENGPVPLPTLPTLSGTLAADGASLTTSAAISSPIADVGWVKIDAEWISYAGVVRGASSTTLQNLERGLFGTAAASHSGAPTIYWGVAADDHRLWEQLYDSAIARLHYTLLHRGTQDDRLNHEKIMGYAQDRADRFWRRSGYVTARNTYFRLGGGGRL